MLKITPPPRREAYPRTRLFRLLDRARKRELVWITAPPGAGKTTLVSSYIQLRKLRRLWYQVDDGDADLASFFHYLGLAVRQVARSRRPLPKLTPEYLAGLNTFARNFFRELFARLRAPAVLVFDNYQELPTDSPLHELLRHGFSEAPKGVTVIVISRREPPAALAALRAGGSFTLLSGDRLQLTRAECRGIVALRAGRKPLSPATVRALHTQTHGWAAGVVLLLAQAEIENPQTAIRDMDHAVLFDYFAGEVFEHTDPATQALLLKTAFLPKITAPIAAALTGLPQAGRVLAQLAARNYFTLRHPGTPPTYDYHPLFREFLRMRAQKSFSAAEFMRLKNGAAGLLERDGQVETAIALYREAGDWSAMTRLVLAQAPELLAQGRGATLEQWLARLPPAVVQETPWLLYWRAQCRLPYEPGASLALFAQAFTLFRAQHDRAGTLLAWCGTMDSFFHSVELLDQFERWIALLDELLKEDPTYPSEEIEARVCSSMLFALVFRRPWEPALMSWAERALALSGKSRDVNLRLQTGYYLAVYQMWMGDLAGADITIRGLHELARSKDASPLIRLTTKTTEAMHDMLTASLDDCLRKVTEGLELAEATGVHLWDRHLMEHGAAAAISAGDYETAKRLLARIAEGLDRARRYDVAYYHFLAAWLALLEKDLPRAIKHQETSWSLGLLLGWPFGLAAGHILSEQVLHERGADREVETHIQEALAIGHRANSDLIQFMAHLCQAQRRFDRGLDAQGLDALRHAMKLGRRRGLVNFFGWRSPVMAELCRKALEADIEVDYVQRLIRKRGLLPPDAAAAVCERWPWPVRVYTLGRFSVVRDGVPIETSARSTRKPLELLAALIAFGGRGVSLAKLTEALWLDAEGDAAQRAFDTTLHRLRRLLACDEALVLKNGRLTFDAAHAWVDIWAFERDASRLEGLLVSPAADAEEAERLQMRLLGFYHGPFLGAAADESWALSLRERTRSRFLRALSALGNFWEARGACDRAIFVYLRGLEVDPLAEVFYRHLMNCYIRAGRPAEACATYERCRRALATLLKVGPAPETQALYQTIPRDQPATDH